MDKRMQLRALRADFRRGLMSRHNYLVFSTMVLMKGRRDRVNVRRHV